MDSCCVIGETPVQGFTALAMQILTLGLAWTSLHCAGMCGPLVAGLGLGRGGDGRLHPGLATVDLLLYQSGRALVYGLLGALAGGMGAVTASILTSLAPVVALAAGVAFLAIVIRGLLPRKGPSRIDRTPGALARMAASVASAMPHHPRMKALAIGSVLGFLPCMLFFWVLGLAAASADPVSGAALAVLLVVMTVPVLLVAAVAPAVVGRWRNRFGSRIGRISLGLSAVWLLLIGCAGLGWIPHAHGQVGGFTVMFW